MSKNEIKELNVFKEQEILGKHFRVFGTPNEPLFLAKDVAEWIEHSDTSKMVKKIDDEEKLMRTLFLSGQNRDVLMLTEDGLYEVLMQSNKPIAKQFKKQVKIVLKDIRKYGVYVKEEILNDPDLLEDVIHKYKEERQKRIQVEKQLEEQKPKIDLYEQTMSSDGLLNFIQVANTFSQCGRNTLMEKLRDNHVLLDTASNWNMPNAKYSKHFKVVVRPRKTQDGIQDIYTTLCKPSALKIIKKVLDKEKDLQPCVSQ